MNEQEMILILKQIKEAMPLDLITKLDIYSCGMKYVTSLLLANNNEYLGAGTIANELDVSTARVAVLLKKMLKKGLIEITTSPTDARKTLVRLSKEGFEYSKMLQTRMYAYFLKLFEKIGADDLHEFIRIANKIKNNISLLKNEEVI